MSRKQRRKLKSSSCNEERAGGRFNVESLNMILLCLLIALSVSCSVRPEVVKSPGSLGFIPFPKPPERVEIEAPGQQKKSGVTYVQPPLQLKPNQVWRAYEDGALVWKPRDWRGVNHILTEWPRWADAMQDIMNQVNKHNKAMEPKASTPKKWYDWSN